MLSFSIVQPRPAIANPGDRGTQEPTAGRWATLVLPSGAALPLAAPPRLDSQEQVLELAELRSLQARRTAQTNTTVLFWDAGAVLRWNEIARALVIKYRTTPPAAARAYALVSVAQYDALVAAWNNKYRYRRLAPGQMDGGLVPLVAAPRAQAYPSEHAVVAGASAAVLSELYPLEAAALEAKAQQHEESRLWAGVNCRSDVMAGDALGRAVAEQVLERARTDGSDKNLLMTVAPGDMPGGWFGVNPLLPLWGEVRPWLVPSVAERRPAPPPAVGSPEFLAALAEVRQISDTRTAEQLRIARYWADGPGTVTPPGHWNRIACDLLLARRPGWSEVRWARALALMNMAIMDAGICCWDAKYAYWLIRPSQADPLITTPVGLPNFPSYTSGHASFSGAASEVLVYLVPEARKTLRSLAEEAALSRLYGGIHYRFDSDVGLASGRSISQIAIERARSDGAPGH